MQEVSTHHSRSVSAPADDECVGLEQPSVAESTSSQASSATKLSRSSVRKKSLSKSRLSNRNSCFTKDFDEVSKPTDKEIQEAVDRESSTGVFTEYIERGKAKDGHWKMSNEKWYFTFLSVHREKYIGVLMHNAMGWLYKEQLTTYLMASIVQERKEQGILPKTTIKSLREQALSIRRIKRTLGGITAEVANWEMQNKVLDQAFSGSFLADDIYSSLEERRQRQEDFWLLYHDRAREERCLDASEDDNMDDGRSSPPLDGALSKFRDACNRLAWPSAGTTTAEKRSFVKELQRKNSLPRSEPKPLVQEKPKRQDPRKLTKQAHFANSCFPKPTSPSYSRQHSSKMEGLSLLDSSGKLGLVSGQGTNSLPNLAHPKPVAIDRKGMPTLFDKRPSSANSATSRRHIHKRKDARYHDQDDRCEKDILHPNNDRWLVTVAGVNAAALTAVKIAQDCLQAGAHSASAKRPGSAPLSRPWSSGGSTRPDVGPSRNWHRRPQSPPKRLGKHWSPRSPGASPRTSSGLPSPAASRRKYLQECDHRALVPDPMAFNTGHSSELNAPSRGLQDDDLLVMAETIANKPSVEHVCMRGNALLTDKGLVPFLESFRSLGRLQDHVLSLDLAGCKAAGFRTVKSLVKFAHQAIKLRKLDISGIHVMASSQLELCSVLGQHPVLESIRLAKVGMGGTCITEQCLNQLLSSKTNRFLDLSWNVFNRREFKAFGDMIKNNNRLQHLFLDNCAGCVVGEETPVSELVERLAHDHSLRSLSLCMNRIDFRGALVIEDSLEDHERLVRLFLKHNPLGVLGLRSILRLICRRTSRLSRLDIEGCYQGIQPEAISDQGEKPQVFSFTNPGGRYRLDLTKPYDRSLCRMLYETADRFGLQQDAAFLNMHYSQPPYSHPQKDAADQYQVLREGILTFTFNVESAIEVAYKGIRDDDYVGFLQQHFATTRFTPHLAKVTPLLANWKVTDGMHAEQNTFLSALAADFNMVVPFLEFMVKACPSMADTTIFRLLPSMPRDGNSLFLAQCLYPSLNDLFRTSELMEDFLEFNPQNPTGHYKLELENSTDFAVAQQLLLLDRWESVVNKRNERADVSQRANKSSIRNETHQGRSLQFSVSSLTEWALPESGEFECDYATCFRPKKGSQPLSNELWEKIMIDIYDSKCRPADRLKVLRSISHHFFLNPMHIRQMLGYFRSALDREEAVVIFFPRLVDMHNAKIFRVRFEKNEDLVRLQDRLGYPAFFPFWQPENARFSLNLGVHDQRLCASMFVQLMVKEKVGNIKEPEYVKPNGEKDKMEMGVPRSWAEPKRIPQGGVFSGMYVCAPEDRQFEARRKLAMSYGYQDGQVTSSEVKWWTGLTEPPEEALDLLEYLISRYTNVDQAFLEVDGSADQSTGNGEITLAEMREGLQKMGCHKFKGPDEEKKIERLFRYLDPGGEGNVSLKEWQVLGQLWSEFDLTIREFVQFLVIAFGEDLRDAWAMLDDDESGELSEAEWFEAVEKIGYFGPARIVFALLDSSDDGDITWDEFKVLEKYQVKSEVRADSKPRRSLLVR
eukprot:TRINITY_DN10581_c2_g1_i1.p1 TRINITY_DN10581_c2_g1~~TRINITY_DN10581_c2_g1_i1.p1  ORF type:complete len:1545 (-),score=273.18 TRINITY_DN10581_c2_g1_i1:24-4658(-)